MYSLNLELKSTIVYEIEHVFGRRVVSSRDCIELCEEIFQKTKHQLNPNTLRRFFSLVKAEYPPSQSTLTILSKYCGFQSIDDIYRIKNTETFETGNLSPDTVLHFFVSLFSDTVVKDGDDQTFLTIVMHSIKFLNANKFLTDRFQSLIARTELGKKYYFESLVNIDKLNSFYGNGLRYYNKEASSNEASVLTTSLYVLKYWLSNEPDKVAKSMNERVLNNIDYNLPPHILARQLAAILFYNDFEGKDNEAHRLKIHDIYVELTNRDDCNLFIYGFSYIISEALFLTGYAGDALLYIEECKKLEKKILRKRTPLNYEHQYWLIEAYALYNFGEQKKAIILFDKIKSSEFPFLSRRFSGILYLSLMKKIKPKDRSEKYEEQRLSLIKETGFKKLSEF